MPQIERIKKALSRLDYFGPPSDDSPLMVDYGNTFYELLDKSEAANDEMDEAKQITLGDLRELVKEIEDACPDR